MPACNAKVEDWSRAQRNNLRRVSFSVPYKACSRNAVFALGHLKLCRQHTELALAGLVEEGGRVAPRSQRQDVRRGFLGYLFRWALKLTPARLS